MEELESNNPESSVKNRDEKGKFIPGVSGNTSGRPKGIVSVTEGIRRKLQECPPGMDKKTYLDVIVETLLHKAINEKDFHTLKQIWNYMDGMPEQVNKNFNMDLETESDPEYKEVGEEILKEFKNRLSTKEQ